MSFRRLLVIIFLATMFVMIVLSSIISVEGKETLEKFRSNGNSEIVEDQ